MSKSFRALMYAPSYENEVVLLFGLLIPHLDNQFVIDEYSGSFPDCVARRYGKEIRIEFEVNSKDFITHKHHEDPNLSKCNLIVCWENYWNENKKAFTDANGNSHEIEVLALKEVIEQKGLGFIQSDKPKYKKRIIWNEPSFFNELRKKEDTNLFSKIAEIYGFCMSRPEFEVIFGEGPKMASFNVRIKKWQARKIGVRSPLQVFADGKVDIDYRKLPENLRMELWRITGEPINQKTGKPKSWHRFDTRDEREFDMIKKALEWLKEA